MAVTLVHRALQAEKKVRGEGQESQQGLTMDEAMETRWRERSRRGAHWQERVASGLSHADVP
jgi:hypothetical protein